MLTLVVCILACLTPGLGACWRQILKECGTSHRGHANTPNDLSEPSHPGVFHDLTKREMKAVRAYLESSINLAKPETATITDPHIYTMMLQMPNKTAVLNHVDHGARQPDRMARVVTFRGDLDPPVVQELVCGPLHAIKQCRVDLTVPFAQRPMEYREYEFYYESIMAQIHKSVGYLLMESYGASVDYKNCKDKLFLKTTP